MIYSSAIPIFIQLETLIDTVLNTGITDSIYNDSITKEWIINFVHSGPVELKYHIYIDCGAGFGSPSTLSLTQYWSDANSFIYSLNDTSAFVDSLITDTIQIPIIIKFTDQAHEVSYLDTTDLLFTFNQ